ncbi:mandelate racemase/muconate lactonizing enzyme family protein [Pseudovibrio sp. Ad26]|uniref:mandelate racemase/muconate lactonizing enzyme family protein n=1 Tax=Pseudovibrio sp. Ad26 TaxID=989410 RepID=UPI0007AE4B8A|nr:mandelate racemase/muconate lactonizing enzyme family protein [Pseudovibrio sp. Ad26]KZL13390.1 D-galactonate dehydratase [Pseudovibrio sp. Ad26]
MSLALNPAVAPIKSVEFIPVNYKASNWSQNTVVVKITDENGVYGLGEADGSPDAILAYSNIETEHKWLTNLTERVIGRLPIEINAIWDAMYDATQWQGMRGLGMFALSGIDMALYDLASKQLGVPAYQLLGGTNKDKVHPYLTLYPAIPVDASLDVAIKGYAPLLEKAKAHNIRAVKVCVPIKADWSIKEVGYYLRELRGILGYDTDMMVDYLYRFTDWYDVARLLNSIEDLELYFAEATLQHDDLSGHAKLVENTRSRICGAEMSTTRFEAEEWITKGKVHLLQSDYNRCGGLTELRRITEMATAHNVQVMPHNWKTGITSAAAIHYQFAVGNAPYFEYVHPDFCDGELRKYLVTPEAELVDGGFEKPTAPGYGIDLNQQFMANL